MAEKRIQEIDADILERKQAIGKMKEEIASIKKAIQEEKSKIAALRDEKTKLRESPAKETPVE